MFEIVREISCARWATAPELRFSVSRVKKRPPPLNWVDQSKLWPAQLGGGGLFIDARHGKSWLGRTPAA